MTADDQGRPLRRCMPRDGGAVLVWLAAGLLLWLAGVGVGLLWMVFR